MSDLDDDFVNEVEQKQKLLQEEIIDKNYDTTDFITFCLIKKENGDDLNNWTLEELENIVCEFQETQNNMLEDTTQKDNDNKLVLKIYVQPNDYLDNKNYYLISYFMGKSEKTKYKKNCSYDMKFEIEKTDFLTFYKTYINVCIYE